MTEREPEWSEEDQAWVLALAEYRSYRCPSCGGDIRECADPEADDRYTVPVPGRCHATTALLIAQKKYAEQPQSEALLWRAERR